MPRPESILTLMDLEGIRSNTLFEAWNQGNRLKGESRYQTLKRKFGEVNADRIMRIVEVASWTLVEVRRQRMARVRAVRQTLQTRRLTPEEMAYLERRKNHRQRMADLGYE